MENFIRFYHFNYLILMLFQNTIQSTIFDSSILINDESMNNRLLTGEAMTAVFSLTHCCITCGITSCSGVFYNQEQKLCVQRRHTDTGTFTDNTGWKYYPKKIPTVDFSTVSIYKMFEVPRAASDVTSYVISYCQQQQTNLVRVESSYQHAILNQFIQWYFDTNNLIGQNLRCVAIDGKQGSDFNWYHENGDSVQYFKWGPGQPNNLQWQIYGNETQLSIMDYEINDLWNNPSIPSYPVLFVCEEP